MTCVCMNEKKKKEWVYEKRNTIINLLLKKGRQAK